MVFSALFWNNPKHAFSPPSINIAHPASRRSRLPPVVRLVRLTPPKPRPSRRRFEAMTSAPSVILPRLPRGARRHVECAFRCDAAEYHRIAPRKRDTTVVVVVV